MARIAYALEQLIDEVKDTYPNCTLTLGEPDGLEVIREASFEGVPETVGDTLNLVPDPRVASTVYAKDTLTVVLQTASPLADDRAEFGIAGAAAVLAPEGDAKPQDAKVRARKR